MANKQLTAKVRLNTTDVESKLKRLNKLFNNLNQVSNKVGSNNQINNKLTQSQSKLNGIVSKVKSWAANQKLVKNQAQSTNNVLSSIGSKLKSIAATYLGLMGAKAVIGTTDTLIGAQNRLNYVNSDSLGSAGFNSDGSYSQATLNATQASLDKMYASSQKVRTSYSGMMSNVSRNMALAGKAFDNNIDNAIRFQEIMAEAYAIGGATAQEMHSSMYQMTQALGAGILAGDELRSVREGAPLAYQAIERFAQKIYGTTESLKELASQGKITSDIVVAAIMDAGSMMDNAFEQTKQTFGQTWDQIKNTALYAFQPVMEKLSAMLQSAVDNGLIQKMEKFFTNVANIVLYLFDIISSVVNWIVDNWSWLKNVIVAGLILIGTYFIITKTIAIASAIASAIAWAIAHWQLLLIMLALAGIIYCFYLVTQGAMTMSDCLCACAMIIAAAFLILGLIIGAPWMIIVAAVFATLAVVFFFFEQICGAATWVAMLFKNLALQVANNYIGTWNVITAAFMNCVEWIVTAFKNAINWICNLAIGLWNSMKAISENIGIAFENAWIGAQNAFWGFIQACLEGIRWLEPAINAVAEAFGAKGFTLSGVIDGVAGKQQGYKSYVSVGDAWSSGYNTFGYAKGNYANLNDAWNKGASTFDTFQDGWGSDAYNIGANWAAGVKDSVNEWGSQFQFGGFDDILGLNNTSELFPTASDPAYDVAGAYQVPEDLLKNAKDTAGNTGKIADSMELTEEDLEYLRKLADMEWKKEFTTATITVDMSNYNTISGDADIDGIVTKLGDKLREELNVVADGVYV